MRAKFYYDDSGELSSDPEGNLVQLCDGCALAHEDVIEWAGDGAEGCELCEGELVMRWDSGAGAWMPVEAQNA